MTIPQKYYNQNWRQINQAILQALSVTTNYMVEQPKNEYKTELKKLEVAFLKKLNESETEFQNEAWLNELFSLEERLSIIISYLK